jgi:hypothetical protein
MALRRADRDRINSAVGVGIIEERSTTSHAGAGPVVAETTSGQAFFANSVALVLPSVSTAVPNHGTAVHMVVSQ